MVSSFVAGVECGHVFCADCVRAVDDLSTDALFSHACNNQTYTQASDNSYVRLKVSGLKVRCPNFKRGCKEEMLAGPSFQNVLKHLEVRCLFALR
jgi:hypothetical protein